MLSTTSAYQNGSSSPRSTCVLCPSSPFCISWLSSTVSVLESMPVPTLTIRKGTNIANAAVFGLADDLNLKGNQYNTALTIFFVPYVLFEIPSNVLLKRLKPHVWLSVCMFMFGLTTVCQGLVQNFGGLVTTRFFLGLFETGMFPGSFYLIGMWYKRHEAQKRYTFFFASTTLAGAFGGLLASAIGKMDGVCGYLGWRWIFILEGILTCVVSIAWFFVSLHSTLHQHQF